MAAGLAVGPAAAQDEVTLQLKWVTQAQFAGYFVAQEQGFYEEEGLNVTIKPGGPDIAPEQVIAGGGADVIVTWMAAGLSAREKGVELVNIAQPFQKSGLMMICPKETGIESEGDLAGHTLGVWFFGNEYPFFAWMNKIGLTTEGEGADVTVLKQSFDVQPLIQGQADCISVMTYNEFNQAMQAGFMPEDLTIFNYTEMGNDMLEDGLYVLEDNLQDPAFFDKMVRFVRASMKGWEHALANPDEAAQTVVDNGGQDLEHQKYMMSEIAKLTAGSAGALDPADYEQTVATLLSAVSPENPAITTAPEGAWTHAITDKALGM
jgi:NitT/TauT family transport system substrate-binding protein